MKQVNAPIHFGIPKKPNGQSWNRFTNKTLVKSDIRKGVYHPKNRVPMKGHWYPNTVEGIALIKDYVLSMTPKHIRDKIVIIVAEFVNPPFSHELKYTYNDGEAIPLIPVYIKNNHIFIERIARVVKFFILEDLKFQPPKQPVLDAIWDGMVERDEHPHPPKKQFQGTVKLMEDMSPEEWKAYMDELAEKGRVPRNIAVRSPELSVEQAILDKLAEDGNVKYLD